MNVSTVARKCRLCYGFVVVGGTANRKGRLADGQEKKGYNIGSE